MLAPKKILLDLALYTGMVTAAAAGILAKQGWQ